MTKHAWDRQPDEPTLWYERFTVYCDLGVTRSLAAAYRHWRVAHDETADESDCKYINAAPSTWYEYAKVWEWEQRATLYDDHIREIWSNDDVLEQARRRRVMLFAQIAEKTGRALSKHEYDETPVNQLSSTMKTAARELREELGTNRPSVKFNVILDQLPPDVQKLLAESLELDE